jgi:phosphoribosylanthranilate isomerase
MAASAIDSASAKLYVPMLKNMTPRVKICGITSPQDAVAAAEAGADAIGLMFYPQSARYLPPSAAKAVISELPPFVAKVGVFVNASVEEVRQLVEELGLEVIQFHGNETPEFCASFSKPVVKAFRVKDRESLLQLPEFQTSAFLLDSFVPGQLGGTGAAFNWDLALEAKSCKRPIILAGGLNASNVAQAVRAARPFAVDVSSGVESAPGIKDAGKMQAFIRAAKTALD